MEREGLVEPILTSDLVGLSPASLDAVVLCSSGTEAVEGALKLARAATGRGAETAASARHRGTPTL